MILVNLNTDEAVMFGNENTIAEYLGVTRDRVNCCYIQEIPILNFVVCKNIGAYLNKKNLYLNKRMAIDRSKEHVDN